MIFGSLQTYMRDITIRRVLITPVYMTAWIRLHHINVSKYFMCTSGEMRDEIPRETVTRRARAGCVPTRRESPTQHGYDADIDGHGIYSAFDSMGGIAL